MYKLMIVDDEAIMRNGLANIVKWQELGFDVTAVFEDGKEAISFLENNFVDIVLTDIKMTFVSGLELAKYVHEQHLSAEVVIISGYKDFEYARSAMKYNVRHYLTKPISIVNINKIFKEIHEELDKEHRYKEERRKEIERYTKIVSFIEEQVFVDAIMGTMFNPKEYEKRVRAAGFDEKSLTRGCLVFSLVIRNFETYIKSSLEYGREELYEQVMSILGLADSNILCYKIQISGERLLAVLVPALGDSAWWNKNKAISLLENTIDSICSITGIKATYDSAEWFDGIRHLAERGWKRICGDEEDERHQQMKKRICDQQLMILEHIKEGDRKAVYNIFTSLMEQYMSEGIGLIQYMSINFFAELVGWLQENNIIQTGSLAGGISYSDVFKCTDAHEIIRLDISWLDMIIDCTNVLEDLPGNGITKRIQRFIENNYSKDITLADVGEYVHMNPVYVSRLFKKSLGINFSEYLINIRLKKAERYLEESEMKVYEVCEIVGYNNIKYFYSLFKRFKGCTPTEYRQMYLKDGIKL